MEYPGDVDEPSGRLQKQMRVPEPIKQPTESGTEPEERRLLNT